MINKLFCELFVNYLEDRDILKETIVKIVGGVSEKFGIVESSIISISIKENELYNSEKYGGKIPDENDKQRPYYYKYRINIEPKNEDIEKRVYLNTLNNLITLLKKEGMEVFLSPDIFDSK